MAGMEIFFVILIIIGILVYNKTIDFKKFMIDNSQVFDLLKEDNYEFLLYAKYGDRVDVDTLFQKRITNAVLIACIFMIFFGKYLSLLFVAGHETSVINDAQQFLICNSIFYFVLGILFVSRNTIQGLGKSALTMLAGAAELVARAFVAFALVGKFGYNAICFANPIAWFAAIIF